MVVIDGDEEGRLGDVDVEGSEYDLIITAADRLLQCGEVTPAARVAYDDGQIFTAVVRRRRAASTAATTAATIYARRIIKSFLNGVKELLQQWPSPNGSGRTIIGFLDTTNQSH